MSAPKVNVSVTRDLPRGWADGETAASIEVCFEYGDGEKAKMLLTATYKEALKQIESTL